MKRLLCAVGLFFACDASQSQPPAPAEGGTVAAPAELAPRAEPDAAKPEAPAAEVTRVPTPSKPLSIVELDPSAGPLAHQLKLHAKSGAAGGQRVVLEMGAPWCPPCKRAKALLADEAVEAQLEGVVVLRADSDVWGEDLDELGFDAPVIPVYYRLDGNGAPSGESVRGDRWKSPAMVREGLLGFLRGG